MGGNVSNQVGPLSDEEAHQIKILTNFSIEEILSCYEDFVKVRNFEYFMCYVLNYFELTIFKVDKILFSYVDFIKVKLLKHWQISN